MQRHENLLSRHYRIGVPFWAIKYLPSDKFGGDEFKSIVIRITDLL